MVGRRKLPDPSLNHIFNALSIGVQYTLSFELLILAWSAYFSFPYENFVKIDNAQNLGSSFI